MLAIGLILLLYAANRLIGGHQLFINAHILTIDDTKPHAQALIIKQGKIAYIGSTEEVLNQARWYSRVSDFKGRTLMPGFVDAHSHFLTVGLQAVTIDLNPPPMGTVGSLDSLYARIKQAVADTPKGDWVLGFNYDNTAYPSGEHPDKRALDQLSAEHKIFLRHNSGHMGVANSAALLELVSHDSDYIGKYPGSDELNGLLQENAAPSLARFIQQFSFLDYIRVLIYAKKSYLSQGFTTVQNGTSGAAEVRVLRWLSQLGLLPMRLVVWASHDRLGDKVRAGKIRPSAMDTDYFSMSTIKLIADGSPQGYTAYLRQPYHVSPTGQRSYRGSPHYSLDKLKELVMTYSELGWTIAIHANGDAAIDDVLQVLGEIQANAAVTTTSQPNVILVHAQTIRADQLEKLNKLGVSPSYFPTHTHYWGDWHSDKTLGPERAATISPLRSTQAQGVRFSIHTDAPVTQVLSMQLLWSATERISTSGRELGFAERIDRLSALKAMTLDAAWQSGLDSNRGSLAVGKHADIIELSGNPLLEKEVRGIKVLRTFIGGKEVFRY